MQKETQNYLIFTHFLPNCGKLAHKLYQFGPLNAFCVICWNEIYTKPNCFRFSQNQMIYSQVKLCKVNFAGGFLFEVVITKQVRSQVRKSVGKESLKEVKRGRKYWRRREGGGGGGIHLWGHKIKGHTCTFSIYLMALKNDLVS